MSEPDDRFATAADVDVTGEGDYFDWPKLVREKLRSKWLRRLAIVIFALFLTGELFVNVTAMRVGAPWVGQNYWHQPIDTYGQFIVIVFLIGFGIYWLVRNRSWWM